MPDDSISAYRSASENEIASWRELKSSIGPLAALLDKVDLAVTARRAAHALQLRDSAALHTWLLTRGLPPYRLLRDWYYVVRLVELVESGSLAEWTLRLGRDPATYYRFVARVTGENWRVLRLGGASSVRSRALAVWQPWRRA